MVPLGTLASQSGLSGVIQFREHDMHRTMLTTLVAAALISPAMFGGSARAMTIAAPPAAKSGFVQKAAVVCGYYGCRRVWPRYYNYYGRPYRPYGWYRRW